MTIYETNDSETPKPRPQARKGEGRMDTEELQSIMQGLITDAESLVDSELSPARAKATDYYLGKPFGNEEDGRSQVVITEVRDTVHGILPSLLRIFFGPDRVVELSPRTAQGVAVAQQATDYVQYVFAEDNKGFLRTYSVLKDGLVRKLGIFKYWWDHGRKESHRDEGITEEAAMAIAARDDVEITLAEQGDDKLYTLEYTVTIDGKPCIAEIPPEEFLFNKEARDPDEALMLAHRTEKRRGDLIAMGISEADLDEYGDTEGNTQNNVEKVERNANVNTQMGHDPKAGEANDKITYVEAFVRLDVDGDGVAELRRVCTIGAAHHVVVNEPADDHPFALFCPIPEPHTMIGQSEADLTMDLQLVKSNVTRSMLDSLSLSIYPRIGFVEGQVSVEDLLNTEIGAPIRMKREGAIQPISHPFTGENAMPILQYFDEVSENRTGRNKGAMGLDADALQSSTKEAVGAAVNSSQEQTEMIARIFAEQTLKPLFRGLYRMIVKYRPAKRIVRLRGTYVQIDTASWEADMDVVVNVALGTSNTEKKINVLMGIAAKQEQILQTYGTDNPLCTVAQLRETYARIAELSGIKDVAAFFKPVDPNWQPPPQPPQQSPEQVLAQTQMQIEQMKTEKDLKIKQAELTLKQQHQEFEQDLKIRQMANDFVLRRYQIDAQFHTDFSQKQLEMDAAQEEAALDGAMNVAKMRHEQELARRQHALDAQQQAHDQSMAEQQQAAQQSAAAQGQQGAAE